jgi:mannobiose 2-epimerase
MGGFYGHRDAKWLTIRNDANKGLVQQARFLFSFSRIQCHNRDKDYLAEMTSTYQFITHHFFNPENGGYYWLCDYQGDCIDHRYVTYGLGFVVYAFSEYYLATKNKDALNKALDLYHLIEAHAFQPSTSGYLEEFDANWKPLECSLLADGINHTVYTLNTSLHLLEAYVNLYKASHDKNVASSIESLLNFIYTHLYDHQSSLSGYLDDALQPLTTITSFGHNIEAAWLMDDAMNGIGISDSRYQSMIDQLTVSVFNNGFNGLYVYNHDWNKELDRTMIWWGSIGSDGRITNYFDSSVLAFGETYRVKIVAKADTATDLKVRIGTLLSADPWIDDFDGGNERFGIMTEYQTYYVTFTVDKESFISVNSAKMEFDYGFLSDTENTIYVKEFAIEHVYYPLVEGLDLSNR